MQGGQRAQQCLQHLAGKHSPEVAFDPIERDREEDEEQPEQET